MKPSVLLAALLTAVPTTSRVPETIPAQLQWLRCTNWTDGATSDLGGWENGTVESNLIAVLEWKGIAHTSLLERVFLFSTNRAYYLKNERVYEPR